MCTAATYYSKDHYFGRNLDLEYSYHETVTVVPRNHKFEFRHAKDLDNHYAMIGMAYVVGVIILAYLVQASCNIRTLVPALFGR